jgi:uncharacterized membrane protein YdjX (TVP38/TMEM64 family)
VWVETRHMLAPSQRVAFARIIPGIVLFVYSGASGGELEWAFFSVGLLATAIVVILITRKTKKKLAEAGFGDQTP